MILTHLQLYKHIFVHPENNRWGQVEGKLFHRIIILDLQPQFKLNGLHLLNSIFEILGKGDHTTTNFRSEQHTIMSIPMPRIITHRTRILVVLQPRIIPSQQSCHLHIPQDTTHMVIKRGQICKQFKYLMGKCLDIYIDTLINDLNIQHLLQKITLTIYTRKRRKNHQYIEIHTKHMMRMMLLGLKMQIQR